MSAAQNLAYATVQVLHNFGAVATVGGSLAALRVKGADARRRLAWLVLAGWGTQAASGAMFGMVSFLYYHKFPDIGGIAVVALMTKMLCAATGFMLMAVYLWFGLHRLDGKWGVVWPASAILAAIALSAAAFLRWFS